MGTFFKRSGWSPLDFGAAFFAALGILLWFLGPYIGRIEGRVFPVVSGFHLSQPHEIGPHSSRITGTMFIQRPRCDFIGVEWFLVGDQRKALIGLTYEDGTKVRPPGHQDFGPWRLDVPPDALPQTVAEVLHQCPMRPWKTRTSLYP